MSNKQYPSLIFVEEINAGNHITLRKDHLTGEDIWVKARGLGPSGFINRVKLAWGVFTGRYDALVWYDEFIENETEKQT